MTCGRYGSNNLYTIQPAQGHCPRWVRRDGVVIGEIYYRQVNARFICDGWEFAHNDGWSIPPVSMSLNMLCDEIEKQIQLGGTNHRVEVSTPFLNKTESEEENFYEDKFLIRDKAVLDYKGLNGKQRLELVYQLVKENKMSIKEFEIYIFEHTIIGLFGPSN